MYDCVFRTRLGSYILPDDRKHSRSLSCVSGLSFSSTVSGSSLSRIKHCNAHHYHCVQESSSLPRLYSNASHLVSAAADGSDGSSSPSPSPEPSDHLENIQAVAYQKGWVWHMLECSCTSVVVALSITKHL